MGRIDGEVTDYVAPARPVDVTRVSVRGLNMTCWKCGQRTTVIVGLHPAAAVDGDLVTCDDEQALTAAAELHVTGNVGLTRPIKVCASRTTGTNNCLAAASTATP